MSTDPLVNLAVTTAAKIKGVSYEAFSNMVDRYKPSTKNEWTTENAWKDLLEIILDALRKAHGLAGKESSDESSNFLSLMKRSRQKHRICTKGLGFGFGQKMSRECDACDAVDAIDKILKRSN